MSRLAAKMALVTGGNGGISRRAGAQTRVSRIGSFVTVDVVHSDHC